MLFSNVIIAFPRTSKKIQTNPTKMCSTSKRPLALHMIASIISINLNIASWAFLYMKIYHLFRVKNFFLLFAELFTTHTIMIFIFALDAIASKTRVAFLDINIIISPKDLVAILSWTIIVFLYILIDILQNTHLINFF
jgi:hypothetical protein